MRLGEECGCWGECAAGERGRDNVVSKLQAWLADNVVSKLQAWLADLAR